MGDRVAIIGGKTPGRDHFPFPVRDIGTERGGFYTNVGNGRFHPVTVASEEACRWCYRVKKWHFALSFDYSSSLPGFAGSVALAFDYQHKWTPHEENDVPGDNVTPTREAELVLSRWGSQNPSAILITLLPDNSLTVEEDLADFELTNLSHSVSTDDGSGEPILQLAFGHDVFSSRWSEWSSGLVPWLYLLLGTTEDTATTGYLETDYFSTTPFPNAVGTLTINSGSGTTFNIPLKATGVPGHYREISNFAAAITAVEYWPYATKAGLPVYNTSTGAQLRDPRS